MKKASKISVFFAVFILVSSTFLLLGSDRPVPASHAQNSTLAAMYQPSHVSDRGAGRVVGTIPVNTAPLGIIFDPNNSFLYVTCMGTNTVLVINTSTNDLVAEIEVGANPYAISLDPSGNRAYVTCSNTNNVSIINTLTNELVGSISVGSTPTATEYDPSNGFLYVANLNSDNVTVINTSTDKTIKSISVGEWPMGIAYDPSNSHIYVSNEVTQNVSIINSTTDKNVGSVSVGDTSQPQDAAFDPANGIVYISNSGLGAPASISLINTTSEMIFSTIPVGVYPGSLPYDFAYDQANKYEYVSNRANGTVLAINSSTNKIDYTIGAMGLTPSGVAYDPYNRLLYVTDDSSTDMISVLNTTSETCQGIIHLGGSNPTSVAYNPKNNFAYVVCSVSGSITVINTSTDKFSASIGVGNTPMEAAFDNATGDLYVTNSGISSMGGGTVSVINTSTNKVERTIYVGDSPVGIAYDNANGFMYVANSGLASNNVSVIDGLTERVIATINVSSQEGQYLNGIAYDPANGNLYVAHSGGDLEVSIISPSTDRVIGNVSAVDGPTAIAYDPVDSDIYVTSSYNNTVAVINSSTNTVTHCVSLPGTPYYGGGLAYDPENEFMYVSNGKSNVSVINSSTYNVTASIVCGGGPEGLTFDSANHDIYLANYDTSTVSVISTRFVSYMVNFSETGLAPGTNWLVRVSGINGTSASSTIDFLEPNGSYSFNVSSNGNYSANPSGGSITVNGSAVLENISFSYKSKGNPMSPSLINALILPGLIAIVVAGLTITLYYRKKKKIGANRPDM